MGPTRPKVPTPAYAGTAQEHARRIIDVVDADNPIGRRAAWMLGWNTGQILGAYTNFWDITAEC